MSSGSHHSNIVAHKHPSDFEGGKIAMWLFLFTEVLLFGGLFIIYAVYRYRYSLDFHLAATELNTMLGATNTIVLLTSSLTVALSIEALKRRNRKLSLQMLMVTIVCALAFMVIKYFEWTAKIHHGIYPGSEKLLTHSSGEIIFYNLYYAMTGLHGIHVIVGVLVLGGVYYFIARKPFTTENINYDVVERIRGGSRIAVLSDNGNELGEVTTIDDKVERIEVTVVYENAPEKIDPRNVAKLENSGLYWHIVDIIWIFLFPLFYLIT